MGSIHFILNWWNYRLEFFSLFQYRKENLKFRGGISHLFFVNLLMTKQRIKVIREEMLQVANNVALEKNINQDDVFLAMEQALEKSARVKYGMERDIRVDINRLISRN